MALDALTGAPRPEDVLLFAVPVCGPYSALAAYKHKVKLVPGGQKKGKAARQAGELLAREAAPREAGLVRGVPEPDMTAAICAGVKLQMPGLQKLQRGQKKGKKK